MEVLMNDKDLMKEKYGSNCIGNVIRILNNRTLLVNVGSDKLSIGNKIVVYTPVEPIFDIDGTELATYEYTKDVLFVIDTNKRYSVCQKSETRVVEPATMSKLALSPLFESREEFVPLNINENEISPLRKVDPKIHIGDPIKLS